MSDNHQQHSSTVIVSFALEKCKNIVAIVILLRLQGMV